MTPAEIESILLVAFVQCEVALCPLNNQQKQILQQLVTGSVLDDSLKVADDSEAETANPLAELLPEQRQVFLEFVKAQDRQDRPWKVELLNDWLHDRDSGSVQFLRDEYGPQWLNRVKPGHIAPYFEAEPSAACLKLKVGDRIEVSNGLWEWVQDGGPCRREWFPCTVVALFQGADSDSLHHNCLIRFANGTEYEIQGIDHWNRYYWRWPS